MILDRFYRRTRKGRIQNVIRERYLRDDVGMGYLVGRAQIHDENELSGVLVDDFLYENGLRVVLVLDTNVVLRQIDVLEQEDCTALYNIILCDTVLQEVKKNDLSIYNRLLVLLRDDKRCFINFPNENHRETWSGKKENESSNDYNDRLIRKVASWFSEILQTNSICKVILVTNDKKCRESAISEGLSSQTIHDFVRSLGNRYPGLLDRVAESQSTDVEYRTSKHERQAKFENHISSSEINRRLQMGTVVQGVFRQNAYNRNEGSIMIYDTEGKSRKIVIKGMQAVNRAIDGDKVAVEILNHQTFVEKEDLADQEQQPEENDGLMDEMAVEPSEATLAGTQIPNKELSNVKNGKVVGIIKRNWRQYCGSVDESELKKIAKSDYILVIPVDPKVPKIRMKTRQLEEIKDKRIIVAIDGWDQFSSYPQGHLVKVVGTIGDKVTETAVLLHEYDIPTREFSRKVMKCLPPEGRDWVVTDENSIGRVDLRHLPICSIDPPGCKDIDDALHFLKLPNGNIEIGVHIADVTHFVREGTPIDEEAAHRGTSTYLVERRLDMLPGLLTTDICSLRGGVDRFAFSVVWEFTPPGGDTEIPTAKDRKKKSKLEFIDEGVQEVSVKFFKSIIHSKAALSYGEAQAWLDDPTEQSSLANNVRDLNRVAKILRKRRNDLGALTLASQEVRFKIDNDTHDPTDVEMYQQKEANALVEEFMLLANITVAKRILKKYPRCSMLRRHPAPSAEMFDELLAATKVAGVELKVGTSKELADSLDHATNPKIPYFNKLLRILTTRCMMQAVYFSSGDFSPSEYRHYGLASDIYTHFTSPIRRYADVIVHRLLAAAEGIDPLPLAYEKKDDMKEIADNINKRHHNAQLAGRASISLHTVVYFRNRPREAIALISRVRGRGVVVMIPEFGIEAKINLAKNEEEAAQIFTHFPAEMKLVHKKTNTTLRIFQQVTVKLEVKTSYGYRENLVVTLIDPSLEEGQKQNQSIPTDNNIPKEKIKSNKRKGRKK